MAKNDMPDLMGEILGGRKTDRKPTKCPQTTHESTTDTPQREALEKYHVRFHPSVWSLLEKHFRAKGISVSAGLRLVVSEYLNREGLR